MSRKNDRFDVGFSLQRTYELLYGKIAVKECGKLIAVFDSRLNLESSVLQTFEQVLVKNQLTNAINDDKNGGWFTGLPTYF